MNGSNGSAGVRAFTSHQCGMHSNPTPGARFSNAPETFRAHKAVFRSSECKNGEVYTPDTSCMK